MAITQIDTLMTGEKKDYDFDFSLKASIVGGETLDNAITPTVEVFVVKGPGTVGLITFGVLAFDVPNHIVQVQNVEPSTGAAGTLYVIKVIATTSEGNKIAVTGELDVREYA